MGDSAPSFGLLILRVDRQIVLYFLHMIAEEFQFGRFGIVANVDVRFEGRFIAKQLVVIGFIRAERDVDGRIQIHPCHIAAVIIVGKKGCGARLKKCFQSQVAGQSGGFAKQAGAFCQIFLIGIGILDGLQRIAGTPLDNGEKAFRLGSLRRARESRPSSRTASCSYPPDRNRRPAAYAPEPRAGTPCDRRDRERALIQPESVKPGFAERSVICFSFS